jgi:hypothetical protein
VADLIVRQGDTLPILNATIVDNNANVVNLTGCTVLFVMRAITAATPTTTATATIVSPTSGTVLYSWVTADTATAGVYACTFQVTTTSSGATYTYPNDGYLEVSIEQNLTTAGGQTLVTLGEAKDYLNFQNTDKARDAKLLRFINQITPVVEFITGPILVRQYDERYDGGQMFIRLRHRPIVNLVAVSEFRGPIEYDLIQAADPAHGDIYSVEIDGGRIVRRSAGGGIISFPHMPQAIHVVYTAGFTTVPSNVTMGTLELLRFHFQGSQMGRPRMGGAPTPDEAEAGHDVVGFFVPNKVRELLLPNKRHPAVA